MTNEQHTSLQQSLALIITNQTILLQRIDEFGHRLDGITSYDMPSIASNQKTMSEDLHKLIDDLSEGRLPLPVDK